MKTQMEHARIEAAKSKEIEVRPESLCSTVFLLLLYRMLLFFCGVFINSTNSRTQKKGTVKIRFLGNRESRKHFHIAPRLLLLYFHTTFSIEQAA